jgi:hypothetical protein
LTAPDDRNEPLSQDALDALERRVIAAAARDVPSAASRERALAAALAALPPVPPAAPPPGGGAGVTAKANVALSSTVKVGLAVVAGVVAIAGAWALSLRGPTPTEAPRTNAPPSAVTLETTTSSAVPIEVASSAPVEAPPSTAPPVASSGALGAPARPTATVSASPRDGLANELRALDEASAALRAGHTHQCLALLNAYDRAFPAGAMKIEASVLRVEALVREGRTAEAERLGDALLGRADTKPYRARILGLLGRTK